MITKPRCLVLLALLYCGLTACKKKAEAAYKNALEKGVVLVEKDTVEVAINQVLLFPFTFADGVNPIHYAWELHDQDTTEFRFLGVEEFHFAPPDMTGGPAAGILRFEPLQVGTYTLVFYNPFYNDDYYQKEQAAQNPYLVWKALKQDYVRYDSLQDWSRPDFEQHWLALQEAEEESKDSLWNIVYKQTYDLDSLPDSTAQQILLTKWATTYTIYNSSSEVLALLDSLLGKQQPRSYRSNSWHDLRQRQGEEKPPLHPSLSNKVYYVRVTPK